MSLEIIKAVAGQLGVDENQAGGVLGTLFGAVQDKLGEESGEEAKASFAQAIPELGGLLEQAKSLTGGGGVAGGLGSLAAGLLGNAGGGSLGLLAQVAGQLGGAGIDLGKLQSLIPVVLPFLASRLSPELLQTVTSLLGGGGEADKPAGGPGLGGLLGGLFGK